MFIQPMYTMHCSVILRKRGKYWLGPFPGTEKLQHYEPWKMADITQTTLSNAFSKMLSFWLICLLTNENDCAQTAGKWDPNNADLHKSCRHDVSLGKKKLHH